MSLNFNLIFEAFKEGNNYIIDLFRIKTNESISIDRGHHMIEIICIFIFFFELLIN
jgi:hypothetical protein